SAETDLTESRGLLLKLFFGGYAESAALRDQVIERRRLAAQKLAELEEIERTIDRGEDLFPYLTLVHGLEVTRATIPWTDGVLKLLDPTQACARAYPRRFRSRSATRKLGGRRVDPPAACRRDGSARRRPDWTGLRNRLVVGRRLQRRHLATHRPGPQPGHGEDSARQLALRHCLRSRIRLGQLVRLGHRLPHRSSDEPDRRPSRPRRPAGPARGGRDRRLGCCLRPRPGRANRRRHEHS